MGVANVHIYWGDGAGENYQFDKNPHISWRFKLAKFNRPLGNTLKARYWLGFVAIFKLSWTEPRYFLGDQYEKLIEIFNTMDAICIYPEPDALPDVSFLVEIDDDIFDFDLIEGTTVHGYRGSMTLEGAEVLTEIPSGIVLMCP